MLSGITAIIVMSIIVWAIDDELGKGLVFLFIPFFSFIVVPGMLMIEFEIFDSGVIPVLWFFFIGPAIIIYGSNIYDKLNKKNTDLEDQ